MDQLKTININKINQIILLVKKDERVHCYYRNCKKDDLQKERK